MNKPLRVVWLGLAVFLAGGATHAAVPLATTKAHKFCEVRAGSPYALDQLNLDSAPVAQELACTIDVTRGSAHGYAGAGFGPAAPRVGVARVEAGVSAYERIAEANLSASVTYYFEILPRDPGAIPAGVPSRLPVLFTAWGEGTASRSGYGLARSVGLVNLYGNGVGFADGYFSFEAYVVDEIAYDPVDEEFQRAGFGDTRHLSLYTGQTYGVSLSAGCSTWVGPVGQAAPASAGCTAAIDPQRVAFDQATFDTLMGDRTFSLRDHYVFAFSPNVPVPEPASLAMMTAGIGLLGLVARRRRTWPPAEA